MSNPIRLTRTAAALILLASPLIVQAAGAARIDFAAGNVSAVSPSGTQRPLGKGSEVAAGETIATGDNGRTQLRFADGAQVSLQPKTEFRIDAYDYKGNGEDKGFFNLLRGGLRTITGLIGRTNKDAYRVTTQVATIGIRGTEYSVGYTDSTNDAVIVHTGEGRVEVCNAAGCVIVSGGESAFVGKNSAPAITGSAPQLPPQQPGEAVVPYAVGDCATGSGGSCIVAGAGLASGNYTVAFAGQFNGSQAVVMLDTPAAATFGANSELLSASDSSGQVLTAGTIQGAFSADGIIGWGVWTSGTGVINCDGSCDVSLTRVHYVAGLPTSSSDISALQTADVTGTYSLIGYTNPTSHSGIVGSVTGGTLTASFTPAQVNVGVTLGVAIGGSNYTLSGTGSGSGSSTFSGSGSGFLYNGFFAGSQASHAGIAYKFSAGGLDELVTGAAAFRRNGAFVPNSLSLGL